MKDKSEKLNPENSLDESAPIGNGPKSDPSHNSSPPAPTNATDVSGGTAVPAATDPGAAAAQSQIQKPNPENGRSELARLEEIIETSLSKSEDLAEALLEIHEHKHYRPRFRSFGEYLEQRWNLSRSRGYQLLHFARLRKMPSPPANERQARETGTDGAHRAKASDYNERIWHVTEYLVKHFERTDAEQKLQFIRDVEALLRDLRASIGVPRVIALTTVDNPATPSDVADPTRPSL